MPTTDGKELTSIGASAVPLGSGVDDFDLAMVAMGEGKRQEEKSEVAVLITGAYISLDLNPLSIAARRCWTSFLRFPLTHC